MGPKAWQFIFISSNENKLGSLWHPGGLTWGLRSGSPMLQQFKTLGEILDGLDIAMCVFDSQDQALAWTGVSSGFPRA